ncbi:MAG TPA: VacJ family lipoprotein [Sphingomonas sp.]
MTGPILPVVLMWASLPSASPAISAQAASASDLPVLAGQTAGSPAPPASPSPPPLNSSAQAAPAQTSPTSQSSAESAASDIVVTARVRDPADPLARANEMSFAATQAVDKAVIAPVSLTFAKVVPAPARDGLGNFIYNLQDIDVCLNFLLQHKFGKAFETAGRFLINTTLGIGGLFDIAKRKPFRLPRRRNGFADTLGFYGVKPGPYLFLPIYGATTVRDLIGRSLDRLLLPTFLGTPFNKSYFTTPTTVGSTLDTRAEFDDQLRKFRESGNPYAARRDFYLKRRQAEIDHLRGKDKVPVGPGGAASAPMPPSTTPPSGAK